VALLYSETGSSRPAAARAIPRRCHIDLLGILQRHPRRLPSAGLCDRGQVDVELCEILSGAHPALDAAHQTYNMAIAKADGNRKVALATCESQSGDSQKACKDQAEADYKTATS
jgi:hypothetical protein